MTKVLDLVSLTVGHSNQPDPFLGRVTYRRLIFVLVQTQIIFHTVEPSVAYVNLVQHETVTTSYSRIDLLDPRKRKGTGA